MSEVFVDSGSPAVFDATAIPSADELDALVAFRAAASRIKAAEAEMRAASQAYGEAIKRLSEASTK